MGGLIQMAGSLLGANKASDIKVRDQLYYGRRVKNNACYKCQLICPSKAIKIDKKLSFSEVDCTGCGICTVVCPSHNLSIPKTYTEIISLVLKYSQTSHDLIFSCQSIAKGIKVPCLALVGFEIILLAASKGVTKLRFLGCKKCNPNFVKIFNENISLAKKHLEYLNLSLEVTLVDAEDNGINPVTRRDFFNLVSKSVISSIGELIPGIGEGEYLTRLEVTQTLWKNLKLKNRPIYLSSRKRLKKPESCGVCSLCVKLCPNGAWNEESSGEKFFQAEKCWNCNNCISACVKNNIALVEEEEYCTEL